LPVESGGFKINGYLKISRGLFILKTTKRFTEMLKIRTAVYTAKRKGAYVPLYPCTTEEKD
jgi:hypothetical protein